MSLGSDINSNLYTGRKGLLEWLNGNFNLNYTKIEQVSTGAAFLLILSTIHPVNKKNNKGKSAPK
jgi:hypothetical protein